MLKKTELHEFGLKKYLIAKRNIPLQKEIKTFQ